MPKLNAITPFIITVILLVFPVYVLAQQNGVESRIDKLKLKINQLQQDIHSNRNNAAKTNNTQNKDTFYRNLSRGDTGADVKRLQKLLNSKTGIQVAQFGPGSPGQETDYFGEKTQQAVVDFQSEYIDKTFTSIGITEPYGYVGMITRDALVDDSAGEVENNDADNTANIDDNFSEKIDPSEEILNDNDRELTETDDQPIKEETELNQQPPQLSQDASVESINQNSQLMNLSSQIDFTKTSFTKEEKLEIVEQIPQPYRDQYYPNLADEIDSDKSTTTSSLLKNTHHIVYRFFDRITSAFSFDTEITDLLGTTAHAQGGGIFGGIIVATIDCDCGTGHKIVVSPPKSGTFWFTDASQAYREYNQNQTGVCTLGTYGGVGVCLIKVGDKCTTVPPRVDGTIIQIGTSN